MTLSGVAHILVYFGVVLLLTVGGSVLGGYLGDHTIRPELLDVVEGGAFGASVGTDIADPEA